MAAKMKERAREREKRAKSSIEDGDSEDWRIKRGERKRERGGAE